MWPHFAYFTLGGDILHVWVLVLVTNIYCMHDWCSNFRVEKCPWITNHSKCHYICCAASIYREGFVGNPCIPQGYDLASNISDPKLLMSHGTGNFTACRLEVRALLKSRQGIFCSFILMGFCDACMIRSYFFALYLTCAL